MNLYDLSIGEDKMNQFLSIALKTHFESLKVSGKGENYWQCYQASDSFNDKLVVDESTTYEKCLFRNIII